MRFIELRLDEISQLFNSMDPSPFRKKDLDRDAEDFIVSWAREIPLKEALGLRIHVTEPTDADAPAATSEAVHNYFIDRAAHARREFLHLMRQGRLSLAIGLIFLAACLGLGELLVHEPAVWADYLRESLMIAGWVAMWRPMQIYLYDWWPIRRQIRDLLRLSTMPVELLQRSPTPIHGQGT